MVVILMRKMVFTCNIPDFVREYYGERFFEVVRSLEMVEVLLIDLYLGKKAGIIQVICNPGFSVQDMVIPDSEVVAVLQEHGDRSLLLVRGTIPSKYAELSRAFPQEVIWTTPTILTRDQVMYSVIGEDEDLREVLRLTEIIMGKVIDISYEKALFSPYNLVQALTGRQQEILILAKKSGYYDNPRKVTLEELSRMIGLSKATIGEHLRKAENQILHSVLKGY